MYSILFKISCGYFMWKSISAICESHELYCEVEFSIIEGFIVGGVSKMHNMFGCSLASH